MKEKIIVWVKRYAPAEVFGLTGTLIGGIVTNIAFHNTFLTALGSTLGEDIGYYGTIIVRDILALQKKHKRLTLSLCIKLFRNLIIEFGFSEYLDGFIIRPAAMYYFPLLLHNLYTGLIVGKFAADVTFYIPTIISYELRNKFLGE